MKKVFKAFTVTSIIIVLTGCTQIRVKENSFETSWTFDEHSHWHACTDAGCVDSKKDVAEHTFNEEVVSPTFEEKGYTLHTCETCGYQYKDNETGGLTEHNYSSEWSSDEHSHWHACTDEGYEDLISDKAEHTLSDEWIIDKEPSTTEQGTKYKKCTVCGRRVVEETIDIIPDELDADSNLIFTELDSGNYSVKAKSKSLNEIIIPNTYKGKAVTKVEDSAFSECHSLASITIPSSVASIGEHAFNHCSSLTSIIIPNSITSIEEYAFFNCSSLTSITIPNNVTSIERYAFRGCSSLTSITIPNSVTSIGIFAFCDCSSLTSVTIPSNVTSISRSTFRYCSSLTSVTIPSNVTSIGEHAFYYCTSLQAINFDGTSTQWDVLTKGEGWNNETPTCMVVHCIGNLAFTELSSGNYSVKAASKSIEEIIIPSTYNGKSVTMVENDAFRNCISLTTIKIPDSVISIGAWAFYSCISLTSITIPNSVASIGEYAFRDCSSLTSITIPSSVDSIGEYAFYNCSSLQTINFDGTKEQWNAINKGEGWNYKTPTSMVVHCIGDLAFTELDSGNYSVKAASKSAEEVIVIPSIYKGKPVTMVENDAFRNCISLTTIKIPDTVTSIGAWAFYSCISLTSITIPSSVASIGEYAFRDCSSVTSITIPDRVASIGKHAFYNCTSLTSITIPNTIKSIGEYAFRDCSSLTSITIPSSVDSIGEYAFYNCTSLQTINFDGTTEQWNAISKGQGWNGRTPTSMMVHCIGDLAFTELDSGNYSVKAASKSAEKVIVPSTYKGKPVTMIEKDAFADCTSLNSIAIPTSVTSIGKSAFYNCTSLTSITIPNSVTSLGACAFGYCESLTSITIPNNVTYIGPVAFDHCTSLKTINFDGTSAEWNTVNKGRDWNNETPTNMVINCVDPYLVFTQLDSGNYSVKATSKLVEEVVIPSMYKGIPVTCIGDYGFFECRSLKSIIIPNSITSIDYGAFELCTSLTSITIPNSVTSIGQYAFYNCSSLQTINFDGTKEQWHAISKGQGWYDKTPTHTVYCSDGKIIYL